MRRVGKNPVSQLKNKADELLTPIIKKLHPQCEACGDIATVGHHFIEKSRSSNLRYNIEDNIISLCQSCHCKIHNRFGNSITGSFDITERIIEKRGREWYDNLQIEGRKVIKVNKVWLEGELERLQEMLENCG